jgi:hypothetical protein
MKLDPETIKNLLATPERKSSTRTRKPKTLVRDIDTWFQLNRELGSDIAGECSIEDCLNIEARGTRHAVTVDVPISPIKTVKMCRRCWLAGRE